MSAPGATLFQLESMLSQLALYAELGLRAEAVAGGTSGARGDAEARRAARPASRQRGRVQRPHDRRPGPAGAAVPAGAGGCGPGRACAWSSTPRRVGPGTLAICGGARGADILFAELALELGADLRMLLALPQAELLAQSVRLPGDAGGWEERFHRLLEHAEVAIQSERLGDPPAGMDVFSRTNLWILDTARVEAADGGFSDDPGLGRAADRRRAGRDIRLRAEGGADEQPVRDRQPDETGGDENDGGRQAREERARASCSRSTAAASAG